MRYPYFTIVGGILAVIGISTALYLITHEESYVGVSSFETCTAAGFIVTEGTPRTCITPDGRTFIEGDVTPTPSEEQPSHANLRNLSVRSGDRVASPLVITGDARLWYFEASFPIEIVDGNGTSLGITPAQAQSDWMTENFVPFKATLTFATPTTSTGTLIFRKDNPSGLPEHDASFSIPVTFDTKTRTVSLYYYSSEKDKDASGNILCSAQGLTAVSRTIPLSKTPITDTINLFLQGNLTQEEASQGISTAYTSSGVTLASISLQGDALILMLDDPQTKTSGGACHASVLRAQLEATARQFEEVASVQILPETLFQP